MHSGTTAIRFLLLIGSCSLGCDGASTEKGTTPPACPTCECKSECADGRPGAPQPASGAASEAAAELSATITRKLAKRDPSCEADVAELERIDPRNKPSWAYYRAQCLMVAGKCAEGGRVLRSTWADTADMLPEQIASSVESVQTMYCTGPLDDRLELLRALYILDRGAYQGNIGIRACTDAMKTANRLAGRVRPKDVDDTQVAQARQRLGLTGPGCLARAGDCAAAWTTYREHQLKEPWLRDVAAESRDALIRENFDSAVARCKGRAPRSRSGGPGD